MSDLEGPQIILSIYNNMKLVGYGRAYIPLQPKLHTVDVALIKPQSSTLLGYLSSFFGYQPELVQPKMLANCLGNDMIVMTSNGKVRLTLNVLQQGLHKLGYDVGKQKQH
ncbi:uncharacterized protein LOC108737704 isoform X2 [Agrilus planipennis]|uniref:B9 domain-containing protein 1 n=1 Tax=Agrilus planipennis TaxID=224129 RepID=A0A1W4X1R5_AGRPL|nr:uncharacterized protein LOC108737704 isoform X2 [Agrilus planipennis]